MDNCNVETEVGLGMGSKQYVYVVCLYVVWGKGRLCSRSLSGGGGKPSCPSPSAGDLRELPRVPLRDRKSVV